MECMVGVINVAMVTVVIIGRNESVKALCICIYMYLPEYSRWRQRILCQRESPIIIKFVINSAIMYGGL